MPVLNIAVLTDEEVEKEASAWVNHQVLRSSTCANLPNSEKAFDEEENFKIMIEQDAVFKQVISDFDMDY